jgi:hypothetical protein
MKKGISLIVVALAFCNVCVSAQAVGSTLVGTYICKGYDPIKPEIYKSTLKISAINDRVYNFDWEYDNNTHLTGRGLLQKEVISVAYHEVDKIKSNEAKPALEHGLQIYRLQAGRKSMNGEWIQLNNDKVGHEDCSRE